MSKVESPVEQGRSSLQWRTRHLSLGAGASAIGNWQLAIGNLLLLRCRQDGREVGRLFLTGDEADFDLLESCPFEPTVQVAFGESEPAVAVKFAGLIEMVLEQVEDHDLAAGFENAMT